VDDGRCMMYERPIGLSFCHHPASENAYVNYRPRRE
jgi:hypothetical protein